MAEKITHWVAHGWDELRTFTPYAAAALVTGGSISSVLITLVWLLEHHPRRERR